MHVPMAPRCASKVSGMHKSAFVSHYARWRTCMQKKGLGRWEAVGLIFWSLWLLVLRLAAGMYACADGFQVRVKGVWHVWEGVCIARRSLAHLHAKKDKGRLRVVV